MAVHKTKSHYQIVLGGYKTKVLFISQPVDLLPYRLEDARRQLELEGDFTLEALTILREAEDERRGEMKQKKFV